MRGEQGKIKEIVQLKNKYKFRLLVDDAHGFGTLDPRGLVQVRNKEFKTKLMFILQPLLNQWHQLEHL